MNWSLAFESLLPTWLLAAAGLLAALLVLPGLFRRMRGAILRAVAAALLFLALLNPVALREDRDALPTVVALVVDKSASQSLDSRDKVTAAARDALQKQLAQFHGFDVRTIEAGGGTATDGTFLFGPLATSLSDVPPDRVGAVIMLTDGQVHDVPPKRDALPAGTPLHVLLSGHDGEIDRRIVIDSAPRFGIVGESQTIRYRVVDDGVRESGPVRVTITRDGNPLSVEAVTPGAESTLTVDMPHAGPNILEFEAEPAEGELTQVTNRAVVDIQGIRQNLRVLLVSGEPHAGERTWRNLLKSDAAVDLVHFTILRPPEKQDGTPINELSLIAFPTRELFAEKIDQFDLIVFDRYQHRGVLPILYFDNIARYVRDGGAVLVAAGPDYANDGSLYETPLSPILPVAPTGKIVEEPFFPRVSDVGKRHPVTRDLDGSNFEPPHWGRWFRVIDVEKPQGEIVMKGAEDKPLLVLNRVEKGRVAILLSDHAWLWARGFEGGGPHVDLLRRLAHWLMKEPELEEEALRASARAGELTVEQQTMADHGDPAIVRSPSGKVTTLTLQQVEPGLWRASMAADEIGLYRVEKGRVAILLSDHAWLWARGFEGGGPHVDLLRRLAHWLMKEPELEEEALRASARAGELTVEQQTMADHGDPAIVRSPSGKVTTLTLQQVEPGLWRASMAADEIGLYRVEQGERRAFAHVGPANPREFSDVRSTDALLKPLVKETGGRIARMADASGNLALPRIVPIRSGASLSGSDWIGIRTTEASVLKGIVRVPLFGGTIGAAAFLALFVLLLMPGLTWFREGR